MRLGDRVELHPGTALWMRGARYGEVVGYKLVRRRGLEAQQVRVALDVGGFAWLARENVEVID